MSETKKGADNTYEGLFILLAFGLIAATVLLAVGGVYYTFINPSF